MREKPPVPEDLAPGEKAKLWEWCRREFPHWATRERIRWLVAETLDYHRATGNSRGFVSWLGVIRNRLRWLEARGLDPFQARDRRSGGNLERQPLSARSWEEVKADQEREGGAEVIDLFSRKQEG
jgi:hypothetical protein